MNLSQHKIPLCQVKEARLLPLKKNTLDDLIHIKFQNMQTRVTESRLFTGTWEDKGEKNQRHRPLLGLTDMFTVLIVVMASRVYTYVKSYQNVYFEMFSLLCVN